VPAGGGDVVLSQPDSRSRSITGPLRLRRQSGAGAINGSGMRIAMKAVPSTVTVSPAGARAMSIAAACGACAWQAGYRAGRTVPSAVVPARIYPCFRKISCDEVSELPVMD
jgi:hypothetical protein